MNSLVFDAVFVFCAVEVDGGEGELGSEALGVLLFFVLEGHGEDGGGDGDEEVGELDGLGVDFLGYAVEVTIGDTAL